MQAQKVVNFKMDEPVCISNAICYPISATLYGLQFRLNKSLITVAAECNINPLSLLNSLSVMLVPYDSDDDVIHVTKCAVPSDCQQMVLELPAKLQIGEQKEYMACIVKEKTHVIGFASKISLSRSNLCNEMALDSFPLSPQHLSLFKLEKFSQFDYKLMKSAIASTVSMSSLQSVANMINMNALHIAAMLNCIPLCMLLIKSGFDVRRKDSYQRTVGTLAKLVGQDKLAKFLQSIEQYDNSSIPCESYLWSLNQNQCNYWRQEFKQLDEKEAYGSSEVQKAIQAYDARAEPEAVQQLEPIFKEFKLQQANSIWFSIAVVGGKLSKAWEEIVFGESKKLWTDIHVAIQHVAIELMDQIDLPEHCKLVVYVVDRIEQLSMVKKAANIDTVCIFHNMEQPQIQQIRCYSINDVTVFANMIDIMHNVFLVERERRKDNLLLRLLGNSIHSLYFEKTILSLTERAAIVKKKVEKSILSLNTCSDVESWLQNEKNTKITNLANYDYAASFANINGTMNKLDCEKTLITNMETALRYENVQERNDEQQMFDNHIRYGLMKVLATCASVSCDRDVKLKLSNSDVGAYIRTAKLKQPFAPEIEVCVRQVAESDIGYNDIFTSM